MLLDDGWTKMDVKLSLSHLEHTGQIDARAVTIGDEEATCIKVILEDDRELEEKEVVQFSLIKNVN